MEILRLFREYVSFAGSEEIPQGDAALLRFDPNDLELDPSPFYERVLERFGVPADQDDHPFGGLGGTLQKTIAFVTERWAGKLHKLAGFEVDGSPPTLPPLSADHLRIAREGIAAWKAGNREAAEVDALLDLARWHWQADRFVPFGKRAVAMLAIASMHLSSDDARVAKATFLCGLNYAKQGLGGRALQFVKEALEIQERTLGPNHKDTLQSRKAVELFSPKRAEPNV